MYQAVNQILFPGKFECNVCREKEGSGNNGVSREAEKKYSEDCSEASEREARADGCF